MKYKFRDLTILNNSTLSSEDLLGREKSISVFKKLINECQDGGVIALFVTSGTYSQQARTEALTSKTYIKLIDGEEFIQMWQDNYAKMSDEDKNMLPLKHIAFVGTNE